MQVDCFTVTTVSFISDAQGRSQDLNQPLQDIAQNFDDDAIIMTLMSLSWRRGKTWKILSIALFR